MCVPVAVFSSSELPYSYWPESSIRSDQRVLSRAFCPRRRRSGRLLWILRGLRATSSRLARASGGPKSRCFFPTPFRRRNMRNLLALLGAAVVAFAVVGWFLGWYQIKTTPG